MLTPQAPEQIGRYRILRPLGSGAMGDVYLAIDPHIDRQLAIKTVRVIGGTPGDIEDRKQRLLREAKAAGKMLHPNIVTLFDADETGGILYLAFEYVPGMDLAHRAVAEPPLTLRQVLRLIREVASALDYAHAQRIVHRDIKPSNILIGPNGEAKVADFGIAKVLGLTEMTRTGSVVGSPQYMSPEQVRGEPLDGRSDVFSLGVVLYELLCRARPFGGDTLSTLIFEILSKEPPSVDQLRPGLPPRLPEMVSRMLAKDPVDRMASARAVIEEADDLLHTLDPTVLDTTALGLAAGSLGSGSSSVSPMAPTATMDEAKTLDSRSGPPPLPPIPAPVAAPTQPARTPPPSPIFPATGAPQPGAPQPGAPQPAAPQPAAPGTAAAPSEARPSPLDTGTYAGAARGKTALWLALGLIAALAAGFFGARLMRDQPSDPSPPAVVESSPVAEPTPSAGPTGAPGPASASPAVDPAVPEAEPSEPAPGSDSRPSASGSTPSSVSSPEPPAQPIASPPPREPSSAPPAAPQPSAPQPGAPQPGAPQPAAPQPATPQATPAPQASQPSATEEATPAESRESRRRAEFEAAAAKAHRELRTGTRFYFEVEPEDTVVKIQAKGERSIVQGRVKDFEPGRDARAMELPGSGDYLITLVHPNHPDLVVLVHADSSVGNSHTVQLDLARAVRRAAGGPQVLRVARGVSFEGQPADAEVWLDGQRLGPASDWPGARLPRSRKNLQLDRGRHTIELRSPGYETLKITVEVAPAASRRIQPIDFQLRRKR